MANEIDIYEVPTEAGTHWHGQCLAPEAVKKAGLQDGLAKAGYVVNTHAALSGGPVVWQPSPLVNGIRNEAQSLAVLGEVRSTLESGLSSRRPEDCFSIIIGGDCSITAPTMAALSHTYPDKRIGMMYVDNDADLTIPSETSDPSSTGILDSMTLANLTQRQGFLPSMRQFSRPDGTPTITSNNIVLFGLELIQPRPSHFGYLLDNQYRCFTSHTVRDAPLECAKAALSWLEERVDLIIVHFDVDVIDSSQYPLGNFPSYGGIEFDAALTAVDHFLKSGKAIALSLTEINPHNDHDGEMTRRLVRSVVGAFESRKQSLQDK